MGYYENDRNAQIGEGWTVVLAEKMAGARCYSYPCLDEAYEAWARTQHGSSHVKKWESMEELITETFDRWGEGTREQKAAYECAARKAGIKDGEPFLAVNPYSEDTLDLGLTDFLPIGAPKRDLLERLIAVDARASEIWEAKAGETYGEFIGRILRGTSCYSLTEGELCRALCVDEWDGEGEEELG